MYLGLDLRGGVHFMLQVDMQAALTKKAESCRGPAHRAAREERPPWRHQPGRADHRDPLPRHGHAGGRAAHHCRPVCRLQTVDGPDGTDFKLTASIKPPSARTIQEQALKQNMVTLHNRINELGVAEPVIQQQGLDRIVVQLPGVQDTAKAKDILGRTATLEVRLVDESAEARAAESGTGPVPFGSERYLERNSQPVIVKKQVILTGENLTDAQPGFDNQTQEAAVHLSLDAKGSRIFRDITRENIGKRMAILLFEKGKGEVVTAPVIRSEIAGGRVQISGPHDHGRGQRHGAAAARRLAGRPDGDHRGTHDRPEPGRREHRQGLQQRDLGFPGDRGLHVCLLLHVRRVLQHCAGCEPVAAGGGAVDAAGHADAARHGGHGAGAGHGDRLQRADQRAGARGTAQRRVAAGGHQRRVTTAPGAPSWTPTSPR
jgi:protein-export membrane protein SecD